MATDRSTFLCPACRQGPFESAAVAVAHCPIELDEQLVGEPAFVPLRAPGEPTREEIRPGMRRVNGEWLYSAAWL